MDSRGEEKRKGEKDNKNNNNNSNKHQDNDKEKQAQDKLISDYDSIIRESALLTTVAAILFGFLLDISVNPPQEFTEIGKILLIISLYSIVIATLLFSMPVVYHHFQYPYRKFEKFQSRYHRFIIFGIAPFFLTLFLSLSLAISVFLDITSTKANLIEYSFSFILASIPFGIILILYKKRK